MAEINDLNIVDASNTARFPENQAPSTVNDGARALEGLLARADKDRNGSVASTGSAGAYVMAANQTLSSYFAGMKLYFKANHANSTTATLNVDAIGAKNIFKPGSSGPTALTGGEIQNGQVVEVVYDGTQFLLMGGEYVAGPDGIITTRGDIIYGDSSADAARLAVGSANTVLGSDGTDAAWGTVAVGALATGTDGELITWDASGNPTTVAVGTTTHVLTSNGAGAAPTFQAAGPFSESFESSNQTITSGGSLTLAHSLSSQPKLYQAYLECTSGEFGYSIGDEVCISQVSEGNTSKGVSIVPDATNMNVRFGSAAAAFQVLNKTTGASANATNGSWALIVRAWA
jgi:hypothetical protein